MSLGGLWNVNKAFAHAQCFGECIVCAACCYYSWIFARLPIVLQRLLVVQWFGAGDHEVSGELTVSALRAHCMSWGCCDLTLAVGRCLSHIWGCTSWCS